MDRCPSSALTFPADNALSPELDFDKCRDCNSFDCAECCPNNALKVCGRKYDVEELMTVIRRDFSHWGVDGGVTFSGGEPMLQHDFLSDVLQRCKELQIHTAIETSSCVDTEIYLNIMRHVDFAFVDIKHTNRERHKEGTGVYNDLILHNISQLKKANFGQRIIVRQPTILGFNDDNKNAEDLIRYMHENDLFEINLLKFHRMGESKWNQLGHDYPYHTGGEVSDERMLELQRLYLDNDIACYIGHDTSF